MMHKTGWRHKPRGATRRARKGPESRRNDDFTGRMCHSARSVEYRIGVS
jgi:hypothetical protein